MAIKVSLICTVKNEENSIGKLLDSILAQTRPADESIIVDGGSTDRTRDIISSYIQKGAPIRLMVKDGANIAKGRNTAIQSSKNEIIAVTDAGCELDSRWLEQLIKPFEGDPTVDVVCGVYRFAGDTHFERTLARIMSKRMPMIDGVILPSSRSIAFKKSAWQRVGGYPEDLRYAEDTTFDYNLKAIGCEFRMAKNAVVVAKVRNDAKGVYKQFFNYSKWDVIANNKNSKERIRKVALITSLVVILALITVFNPLLGFALLGLVILYYFFRYGILMSTDSNEVQDIFNGPLVVFSIMSGEILGALSGVFSEKRT